MMESESKADDVPCSPLSPLNDCSTLKSKADDVPCSPLSPLNDCSTLKSKADDVPCSPLSPLNDCSTLKSKADDVPSSPLNDSLALKTKSDASCSPDSSIIKSKTDVAECDFKKCSNSLSKKSECNDSTYSNVSKVIVGNVQLLNVKQIDENDCEPGAKRKADASCSSLNDSSAPKSKADDVPSSPLVQCPSLKPKPGAECDFEECLPGLQKRSIRNDSTYSNAPSVFTDNVQSFNVKQMDGKVNESGAKHRHGRFSSPERNPLAWCCIH